MTNAQVAAYRQSAPAQAVDVVRCLNDAGYADELFAWVTSQPAGDLAPLVYATTDPTNLSQIKKQLGADEASAAVERTFGKLATLLAGEGFDTFIVAGGETSGIVVQSLGVTGFHIGPQIARRSMGPRCGPPDLAGSQVRQFRQGTLLLRRSALRREEGDLMMRENEAREVLCRMGDLLYRQVLFMDRRATSASGSTTAGW